MQLGRCSRAPLGAAARRGGHLLLWNVTNWLGEFHAGEFCTKLSMHFCPNNHAKQACETHPLTALDIGCHALAAAHKLRQQLRSFQPILSVQLRALDKFPRVPTEPICQLRRLGLKIPTCSVQTSASATAASCHPLHLDKRKLRQVSLRRHSSNVGWAAAHIGTLDTLPNKFPRS